MTTASALIEQTLQHLQGNQREEINRLNGAYTSGGTSLTFEFAMQSILPGAEVEIDLEVFRVMSVSGQTATVIGAQRGTTNANHADDSIVRVNPRFFRNTIFTDLNHTLDDLSAEGLYREVAIDVTFNPVVSAYDLAGSTASTVQDILKIDYRTTGPSKRQPAIRSWTLLRGVDTAVFPSGTAVMIDGGGFPGLPLRIRYAATFTALASVSSDVTTDSGLAATADDLPPIGAAIRQMMGRDARRSFLESQPDTRRSNEVPSGAAQGAIRELRRMWDEGVGKERARQLQRYPYLNRRAM